MNAKELERLRDLAQARGRTWRSLLIWAEHSDREHAMSKDGPGLALTALMMQKSQPLRAQVIGRQAVACAMSAVRAGRLKDLDEHAERLGDVALTLDWAWPWFSDQDRGLAVDWLVSQAGALATQPRGGFDSRSMRNLRLLAFAGMATAGLAPGSEDIWRQAMQLRFKKEILPCLQQAGQGGGWFEGSNLGAQAGLDLLMFVQTVKMSYGEDYAKEAPWFSDRLEHLVFSILPQMGLSPQGYYHQLAPVGEARLEPIKASDFLRLQMELLAFMRPQDRAAGWAWSLLWDLRLPGVIQGHLKAFEFMWLNLEAVPEALSSAPLTHWAPSEGVAFLRSDWSPRATWISLQAGPHFSEAQHLAAGAFNLFRLAPLAWPSGTYDGPSSPHLLNYGRRSVAHNTILIQDPTEYSWYDLGEGVKRKGTYANDGGQRAPASFKPDGSLKVSAPFDPSGWETGPAPFAKARQLYNMGAIQAVEDATRFSYARADATPAYQGSTAKARRVVRHLFLLRGGGPQDFLAQEVVVVVDDILVARPKLQATFVLHSPNRPTFAQKVIEQGPGLYQVPGDRWHMITKNGALEVLRLWPRQGQLRMMGGQGLAASYSGGRNYPPRPPAAIDIPWRMESTTQASEGLARPMVHCLLPVDVVGPSLPQVNPLLSPDPLTVGLVIIDPAWPRVLAVRLGPPDAKATITYQYPGGRTRHLVAGLMPDASYKVVVEGERIKISPGQGHLSTKAGLLAFQVKPRPAKK